MELKPGYNLIITTWENDLDHVQDLIIHPETLGDARFYIEVARLFRSTNNHNNPGLGNESLDMDEVTTLIKEILKKHDPDMSDNLRGLITDVIEFEDQLYDWLVDEILGFTVEYVDWEYFARVYYYHKLYYIDSIKDLTEEVGG